MLDIHTALTVVRSILRNLYLAINTDNLNGPKDCLQPKKPLCTQPETRTQDAHPTFLNKASHNDNACQSWVTACYLKSTEAPKQTFLKILQPRNIQPSVKGTWFPFNACPFFIPKLLCAGSERSMARQQQSKTNPNPSIHSATELDRDSNANHAPDSLKTWQKKIKTT